MMINSFSSQAPLTTATRSLVHVFCYEIDELTSCLREAGLWYGVCCVCCSLQSCADVWQRSTHEWDWSKGKTGSVRPLFSHCESLRHVLTHVNIIPDGVHEISQFSLFMC